MLRVAYTTDGVNFSDTGLVNDGVISGENKLPVGEPVVGVQHGQFGRLELALRRHHEPELVTSPANLNQYAANDVANGTCSVIGRDEAAR